MDLAHAIYAFTDELPRSERFGIVAQVRRASVSVPSNIAEGNARHHRPEYLQHLRIARGSLAEVETQILLCDRLGWTTSPQLLELITSVRRQLQALINSLDAHR